MFKDSAALFLYAETPFHPGSGASIGPADLPVQRERTTGHPIMNASGVKGGLRAWYEDALDLPRKRRLKEEVEGLDSQVRTIFGPPPAAASEHAGSITFTDLRVLLFPVRAAYDLFAWITCPQVLHRFKRDLTRAGISVPWKPPNRVADGRCLLGTTCSAANPAAGAARLIILEEYAVLEDQPPEPQVVDDIAKWLAKNAFAPADAYWAGRLFSDDRCTLGVLSDRDYRDFTELATETITRIRIDPEKGTADEGALWTEEHVPSETLLYASALAADPEPARVFGNAEAIIAELGRAFSLEGRDVVQLGGDETVGRGFLRGRFHPRPKATPTEGIRSGT